MPTVEVHGMQIHIPHDHVGQSTTHALHFLEKNKGTSRALFHDAREESTTRSKTGVIHFETNKPAGYKGATDFTLVHTGHHQYELRKRKFHLLG